MCYGFVNFFYIIVVYCKKCRVSVFGNEFFYSVMFKKIEL